MSRKYTEEIIREREYSFYLEAMKNLALEIFETENLSDTLLIFNGSSMEALYKVCCQISGKKFHHEFDVNLLHVDLKSFKSFHGSKNEYKTFIENQLRTFFIYFPFFHFSRICFYDYSASGNTLFYIGQVLRTKLRAEICLVSQEEERSRYKVQTSGIAASQMIKDRNLFIKLLRENQ